MTNASAHEEAQLLARVTILEHVVALIVRDSMVKSGQSAQEVLVLGEQVKAFFANRTPSGATSKQLNEAADSFFTAVASDIGSRDNR